MAKAEKNTRILTNIAFKKLANASITNPGSSEFQEPIGTNIQLGLGTIFGEILPTTPPTTLFETSSGAVVQYVEFDLVAIAEGNYNASTYSGDSSNYDDIDGTPGIEDHAFAVVLSGSYETDGADNPKSGTGLFTNGAYLSGSDGTLQLVPPSYGVAYQAVVVDENGDDLNIAIHEQDFYIDYYAGVVFRQDGGSSPYPTKLKAYLYTGDYADTTIRSGSFSGSFEGDGTNLDLSNNSTVPSGYSDSDVTDHINTLGVISGSAQVNADNITNFDTNVVTALPAGTVSGSAQTIANLPAGTISGSSQLPAGLVSASAEGSSQGQINLNGVAVNINDLGTNDSPTFTDLTLSGNLIVQGTTTTVDSTTVNISSSIVRVNYGGAVAEGGIEVTDATGGNTVTGSLLWDGNNDYWKGGPKGSEVKFLREEGDGIISSSAQVNADSIVNFDTNVVAGLPAGTISGSSQVNADSIINFDTNVVAGLPAGTISGSSQIDHDTTTNFVAEEHFLQSNITTVGTVTSGDISAILPAGTISGSSQVSLNTDNVSEGSNLYYTDGKVKTKLNTENVISSSAQVNADSIVNFDTNVIAGLPAGTISGSSQVNADSIVNFDTNVVAGLPVGTVSGSSQIDHDQTTNFDAAEHFTQGNITTVGTVTTGDVSAILPAGTISGSSQVSLNTDNVSEGSNLYYTDGKVKTKLNTEGVISSSAQLSNTFLSKTGDDVVSGSAQIKSLLNSNLGGAITIGDANDGVIIPGDLTVQGTTTTVNSTEVEIGDNIIILNSIDAIDTDGGINVHVSSSAGGDTGSLVYDTSEGYWVAGNSTLTNRIAVVEATPVDNGFAFFSGSNDILVSIAQGNAGSFLQSDGDGTFTVSAVIDGGTY